MTVHAQFGAVLPVERLSLISCDVTPECPHDLIVGYVSVVDPWLPPPASVHLQSIPSGLPPGR
ncbi:hypothetical protein J6590_001432 [Homalodisca vitripennis]|nr:hypothetical protein J6590_001432 [Homalodisca vitripennis]